MMKAVHRDSQRVVSLLLAMMMVIAPAMHSLADNYPQTTADVTVEYVDEASEATVTETVSVQEEIADANEAEPAVFISDDEEEVSESADVSDDMAYEEGSALAEDDKEISEGTHLEESTDESAGLAVDETADELISDQIVDEFITDEVDDSLEDSLEVITDDIADAVPLLGAATDDGITEGNCGAEVTWSLDKTNKVLTISGSGAMTDYTQGKYTPWYADRLAFNTVIIDDGVTSIGNNTFYGCSSIESVSIADSVTSIGEYAFYLTVDLTTIEIPASVTSIQKRAFMSSGLSSINIPDSVTSIGSEAFSFCKQLVYVSLPEGITSIEQGTFSYCTSLTSLKIPESVTSIGTNTFTNCSSLRSIQISNGVKIIGLYAFNNCSSLTSIVIPEGVQEIYNKAFLGCTGLQSISLPKSIKEIDASAFEECTNLGSVYFAGTEDEWNAIKIAEGNECLSSQAEIHYGSEAPPEPMVSGTLSFSKTYSTMVNKTVNMSATFTGTESPADIKWSCEDDSVSFSSASVQGPFVGETGLEWYISNAVTATKAGDFEITVTVGDSLEAAGKLKVCDNYVVGLYPEDGAVNVGTIQTLSVSFAEPIAYAGEGSIRIYEAGTEKPIEEIRLEESTDSSDIYQSTTTIEGSGSERNGLTIIISFKDWTADTRYYVTIDPGVLKFVDYDEATDTYKDTGNVFKGIGKDEWSFTTVAADILTFINPCREIKDYIYQKVFRPKHAEFVKSQDDGSKGLCYGMSYTVAAWNRGYTGIKGVVSEDSLAGLDVNYRADESAITLLEYIQLTHISQFTKSEQDAIISNKGNYKDLYHAVVDSLDEQSDPVIIGVYGPEGGHAVLPLALVKDGEESAEILVYNCGNSGKPNGYIDTLILYKDSGEVTGFSYHDYNEITYGLIDTTADARFYDLNVELESSDMVRVKGEALVEGLKKIVPLFGSSSTENNSPYDLYWTEKNDVSSRFTGGAASLEITDGYKELSVASDNVCEVYLSLDDNLAQVIPESIESVYEITYSEAKDYELSHEVSISGRTDSKIIAKEKDGGIIIDTADKSISDITITVKENDEEVSLLDYVVSHNTAKVVVDGKKVTVLEDKDGDGDYETELEPETQSDVPLESIIFDRDKAEMPTLTTLQLKVGKEPENANQEIVWSSSNENAATVDENGVVSAKQYGTTVITAESAGNSQVKASCEIKVLYYDVTNSSDYWFNKVYWAADRGITKGYGNVYFGPEETCTRGQLMVFLWRLAGQPSPGSAPVSFTDLSGLSTTYRNAIIWGYNRGITRGYSDGSFQPNRALSRKDIVIMLYRYAGKPKYTDKKGMKFKDVVGVFGKNSDTYNAICWAYNKGITNGYSSGAYAGKFGCELSCLRKDIATFLYRYAN